MYRLIIFGLLLAVWVVFSGQLDAFHLLLGVLSAALVTSLSSDLMFPAREQGWDVRLRQAVLLPGYLAWLFWEIVLANIDVLRLALHPGGVREVRPRMVEVKTRLRSGFGRWLLACSITLTPGTVTARVRGQVLYVHALNEAMATDVGKSMEKRIARIFEPEEAGP